SGFGVERQTNHTAGSDLKPFGIKLPEPTQAEAHSSGFEPAWPARLRRELLDLRRSGRLLEPPLQPQPVEADKVAHFAALAVDEAIHDSDKRPAGISNDADHVVEGAVLPIHPGMGAGALEHHSERVLFLD